MSRLEQVFRQFPAAMKLAGRRGRRIVLLAPDEVLWIGVQDRLVFLNGSAERFRIDRTLSELESMLSAHGFFRISRSEIVNLKHARELIPRSSGVWRLVLANGHELSVSRERARELRPAVGF